MKCRLREPFFVLFFQPSVNSIFTSKFGHSSDVFDFCIILDNGVGIHDIAAILSHFVDNFFACVSDFILRTIAQEDIVKAAAYTEFVAYCLVDFENITSVNMIDDTAGLELSADRARGVEVKVLYRIVGLGRDDESATAGFLDVF